MTDDIEAIRKALSSNELVVFIGNEVSIYTNSHARGVSLYNKEITTDTQKPRMNKAFEKITIQIPDLVQVVGDLECPVVTTNYDLILEGILGVKAWSLGELCSKNLLNDCRENLKTDILHIFGHIDDPSNLILSQNSFDHLRSNSKIPSIFRALFENKLLLFIGYRCEHNDSYFSDLVTWLMNTMTNTTFTIYNLVKMNPKQQVFRTLDASVIQRIHDVPYGRSIGDLVPFLQRLRSIPCLNDFDRLKIEMRELVRIKYLQFIIDEYGHVPIFGYSNNNITLPLQSVFVELKFDPTHPSIKAMKTIEIHEEFKRKLLAPGFFTSQESRKLNIAILEKNGFSTENIYRDFMLDQWVNVLLSNRDIFTEIEANTIKDKIDQLKRSILDKNNHVEAIQYRIQQAYNEFKHMVVLGHPGSGKTTLSKWLVTNMAKQCLGENNMLFDGNCLGGAKLPILIPIWKYVDQLKENHSRKKQSLLQFVCDNSTLNSALFNEQERHILSMIITENLLQENILIVLEGLDEVPSHVDRADLMREINSLLERRIEYDDNNQKLIYSNYEQKEINSTQDCAIGNRCIITSRIEGNYFEDINFYIPRLTIENMSADALHLFCTSYMQCISDTVKNNEETTRADQGDKLYHDISQNKDIFQLAINPQLASVIAAIYYQYGDKLPENRIDLYEKAIAMMIDRVVILHLESVQDEATAGLQLDNVALWTIWQEIAHYLHSRVEGLSEDVLKSIIKQSLVDLQKQVTLNFYINIDDFIVKLVEIFKYQAGLLNEFGHNSFRFIHRTFQEYLAAKSIIYVNGTERSETMIYEKIREKMAVPNWRVPLSMTFGILSRSNQHATLFDNIIARLLKDGSHAFNTQCSTELVPFVIIDSFHDIHFSSESTENNLVKKLADMLLLDYKNLSGFSRLKEHQELIHAYFMKLKTKYATNLAHWFMAKINHEENLAPCAYILLQLKWYSPIFHQVFLENLHYDSSNWNWPIDSLLRFYSNGIQDPAVEIQLKFRTILHQNPWLAKRIAQNSEWLSLIVALYGGYKNYRIANAIKEYHETAQFLNLTDTERAPFLFYYQEIWGREDPAYQMAVHLDTKFSTDIWKTKPIFDRNNIYKESSFTGRIFELLSNRRSARDFSDEITHQLKFHSFTGSKKMDAFVALVALGRTDIINNMLEDENDLFIRSFRNRIEQIMISIKDPISRFSSQMEDYLMALYNRIQTQQLHPSISFADHCKIYLSILARSGGLPVDIQALAQIVDNLEDKYKLFAEVIAYQFTGSINHARGDNTSLLDRCLNSNHNNQIIQSFIKLNEAVQLYRPVRAHPWSTDIFTFRFNYDYDVPIAFFNCLENMNPTIGYTVQALCEVLLNEGLYHENSNLIPLVVLLNFGVMSKEMNFQQLYDELLPDFNQSNDIKEFLLNRIQTMSDPYYKARGLYQLAQFDDKKCNELLRESFELAQRIDEPILKFQVLEKIFSVSNYKNVENKSILNDIISQLITTSEIIQELYNRIIAMIRLSFYGSAEFRKKYLKKAISLVTNMDNNYEKIEIIMKLRPLMNVYDDLHAQLDQTMKQLPDETQRHFMKGYYGKVLSNDVSAVNSTNYSSNLTVTVSNSSSRPDSDDTVKFTELRGLFFLFVQLNDMKLMMDQTDDTDQSWLNLLNDIDNAANMEQLIKAGLETELFLTPQAASVIDELLNRDHEDKISILFPYLIKPANEVMPMVQKWFTDSHHPTIQRFAALLLAEAKHIFAPAIDSLISLLESNNDQIRYRAQRVFQHPERDVQNPSKRISVIGEKTLSKLLNRKFVREKIPRVRIYLSTFFFDLQWDDPTTFRNLHELAMKSETNTTNPSSSISFNRMHFVNSHTWQSIVQSITSTSSSSYCEDLLQSAMALTQHDQITPEHWIEFARILSARDISQLREQSYLSQIDLDIVDLMLDEICAVTNVSDEAFFDVLESKIRDNVAVTVGGLLNMNYDQAKHIGRCNFYLSRNLNAQLLNRVNNVSINLVVMENLLRWLIQNLTSFNFDEDQWFVTMLADTLLSLISVCVQKEDYLYRKVTNSPNFDKIRFIEILERTVHDNPCFPSRGNAFILLAALDHSNFKVIINAMNTLLDENTVKEYTIIGIPLIRLSPDELIDELLGAVNDDSAVKAYEILRIFTQYALDEKIDASTKSKIIDYVAKEIGQLKSKKPINYYYTDLKIPFTTTLENELYKSWIKIQGLSGKAQYTTNTKQ